MFCCVSCYFGCSGFVFGCCCCLFVLVALWRMVCGGLVTVVLVW